MTGASPTEVDVLIVGGGAAGLASSMLLSSYGITTHLASRYPKTSNLPKAHVVAIKTMEIFRELGLETKIRERATPPQNMRYATYTAGFAGPHEDYGRPFLRISAWGCGQSEIEWLAASDVQNVNLMQSQLEPLMKSRAEDLARGNILFNHSFVSFEEEADGILATVEDRVTGAPYQVRARYILACDGGRALGPQLGVEMEGSLAVATSISIHFTADLSRFYPDDEALTTVVMNPDLGMPCVLVPMGPDIWGAKSTEWLVHMISFAGDHKAFDDDLAVRSMLSCLGLPDLDLKVHVINRWPLDAVVASKFRAGRVFFLGDAAHRVPPAGGHGLNMAVQDAYNLCWKLAAAIRGHAGDALLDSYETERRAFAQFVVPTTFKGWQINRSLIEAIGFSPKNTPDENWAALRSTWAGDDAGEAVRQRIRKVIPGIMPNYESLYTAFGYHYETGALVSDGTPNPGDPTPLGIFRPTTRPGHSVPNTALHDFAGRHPIGDLVGSGRFVLIAGEDGGAWRDAARAIAAERHILLTAFTIGSDAGDWMDIRGVWAGLREHGPAGAILIRPDRFIAWRVQDLADDPYEALEDVFRTLGYAR